MNLFGTQKKVSVDEEKIQALLTRGVEDIFVKESLLQKLKSGKQLRVKFGIDPTGKTIHIGRAVPLWKLRKFQELGHVAVLIVGDFTAQIGDASDKTEKRPMLSMEQVRENLKQYKKIIGKIIDLNKAEFVFNGRWLNKLTFKDACTLAESFSVQQMSNRRNFKERFERGEEVSLREFLYPLMQGYDSVAVRADVEIGGFDQLFNVKAGRVIQKHYQQPEQDVLTVAMLEGTDGRKMSTSWGNVINITDEPNDMFGKVMTVRDELIGKYFLLTTDTSLLEIERMENEMREGKNPKEVKEVLAEKIVMLYHGEAAARAARAAFGRTFSDKQIPESVPEVSVASGTILRDVLVAEKIVSSKSDFQRLVEQGAISILNEADGGHKEKITDPAFVVEKETVFKIGARRFIKIKIR